MEFRDLVKEVVRSACRTALLEAGFTPDDYFFDGADSPGLGNNIFTIYVSPSCPLQFYCSEIFYISSKTSVHCHHLISQIFTLSRGFDDATMVTYEQTLKCLSWTIF